MEFVLGAAVFMTGVIVGAVISKVNEEKIDWDMLVDKEINNGD